MIRRSDYEAALEDAAFYKAKSTALDRKLEGIFQCMDSLFVEKELSGALKLLTELGRVLVESDRASFWYWDKRAKQLWTMAATGIDKISIPEDAGVVGYSVTHNEVLIINNPYNDYRFNQDVDKESGYRTKSILSVPVSNARGVVIGCYQAVNKISETGDDLGEFSEEDVRRMSLAAAFCGKTLESYMLYDEVNEDPLTGLMNRRGFYSHCEKFVKPLLEQSADVAVIMCDIDFFKKVNDRFGHNAGDEVLRNIGECFSAIAKVDYAAFRWGGEEFVWLLPRSNVYQAGIFAEQLRDAVSKVESRFEKYKIIVTMSFGVAACKPGMTIDDAIKVADDKLYEAKQQGRNRVVFDRS